MFRFCSVMFSLNDHARGDSLILSSEVKGSVSQHGREEKVEHGNIYSQVPILINIRQSIKQKGNMHR